MNYKKQFTEKQTNKVTKSRTKKEIKFTSRKKQIRDFYLNNHTAFLFFGSKYSINTCPNNY